MASPHLIQRFGQRACQSLYTKAREYDLRHFAISFWLLAGVSISQAAAWAGNSESVIWAFYAKLMSGQEKAALDMIDRATTLYGRPVDSVTAPDSEADQA
ncbi:site-specific integrase [Catelliglobosispora koreensis]|uniref:hypothetical protein n=1 Tax=Catelliglobosispora koreensis TaxID=129052 RepID=UPI00039FE550|nr:hypothetical protein [Catelliglobosispora koreensis]